MLSLCVLSEGFSVGGHPPVAPPWGTQSLAEIPSWTQPMPNQTFVMPTNQPTPLFPPEQDMTSAPCDNPSYDTSAAPPNSHPAPPTSHSLPPASQAPPPVQSGHEELAPPPHVTEESSRSLTSQLQDIDDLNFPLQDVGEREYERRLFRRETQSYDYNHRLVVGRRGLVS